jgi:LytS/YehU family sensor histidine kinase
MTEETSIVIVYSAVASLALALSLALWRLLKQTKRLKLQSQTIKGLQNSQQEKLTSLETTLNPHLFKNVLNSIQSHAYQTYFALDKLANVLDYILYDSRQPFVTPKDEITFMQNLIEINKIKLSPLFELHVKSKINEHDEWYNERILAPLITIDLIENAFKHADIQSADSFIKVITEFQRGTFSLTVANKVSEKPPLSKPKSGFGQKTLYERLQLIYGDYATLERRQNEDQYIAQLKIRLRDYKTEMYTP